MATGILVIDKPKDISSFQAVARVKRKLGIKKAGHTGTLDPMATGLLTICLGRATRMARFLTDVKKQYMGILTLGVETDSYDAHGKIESVSPVPGNLTLEALQETADAFTGRLSQAPPAFSAAKHRGVPLYKLARKGIRVKKEARQIEVFRFTIDAYDPPDVSFTIDCSKGTYIRALAHDFGRAVGCGAHLSSLRRTRNGLLSVENAIGLEDFLGISRASELKRWIMPVEFVLSHIPAIVVDDRHAQAIQYGQGLAFDVAVESLEEQIPGFGSVDSEYLRILTRGKDGALRLVCIARWPGRLRDGEGIEILRVWNPN